MPNNIANAPGALGFTQLFKVENGRVAEGYLDPYERHEDLRPVPFEDGWYWTDPAYIEHNGPFPYQAGAKRAALEHEKPFYVKDGCENPRPVGAFLSSVLELKQCLTWMQHTGQIDPAVAEETVSRIEQTEDIVTERMRAVFDAEMAEWRERMKSVESVDRSAERTD
jgi:hypothetical protein